MVGTATSATHREGNEGFKGNIRTPLWRVSCVGSQRGLSNPRWRLSGPQKDGVESLTGEVLMVLKEVVKASSNT